MTAARERWRRQVEAWGRSGLTAKEYAARAGVSDRSLTYWKWRLRKEAGEATAAQEPAAALGSIVEVRTGVEGRIEVELPSGRRIRVPASFDAAALRGLVEALEQRS